MTQLIIASLLSTAVGSSRIKSYCHFFSLLDNFFLLYNFLKLLLFANNIENPFDCGFLFFLPVIVCAGCTNLFFDKKILFLAKKGVDYLTFV
jgi:hypothetical protein